MTGFPKSPLNKQNLIEEDHKRIHLKIKQKSILINSISGAPAPQCERQTHEAGKMCCSIKKGNGETASRTLMMHQTDE